MSLNTGIEQKIESVSIVKFQSRTVHSQFKSKTTWKSFNFCLCLSRFHKACVKYGVADVDLFQTTDLWDQKNIVLVTTTIFAIGRTAYKHPEWRGPCLGPKPSEENRREFSEQTLRASEGIIGLQAGTNKGATQAGQNFGASRKIILGKWDVISKAWFIFEIFILLYHQNLVSKKIKLKLYFYLVNYYIYTYLLDPSMEYMFQVKSYTAIVMFN